jgi:ankyrin repeat protein
VTQLLIQHGADIHKPNQDGETPFSLASHHGQLETAHLLLKSGSNVNSQDNDGLTPLHRAVQSGHLEIIKLLLGSGADVNIQTNNQKTPLDVARDNGQLSVERVLAEWTRKVDSEDRTGPPALEAPSQDSIPDNEPPSPGHGNDANILDRGASLHRGPSLHRGASLHRKPSPHRGPSLRRGASLHRKLSLHRGPSLHSASSDGNLKFVQSLLDGGVDVDDRDADHATALHIASREGKSEVALLLIKYKTDVNTQNGLGETP